MRFLPHTAAERQAMLDVIGAPSVDALYSDVPEEARLDGRVDLPKGVGEQEVERIMRGFSNQNNAACDGPFFLGAGCYYHHIPATVDMVIQRSEFLTAYTPYQPEIAQGTLSYIFEFQSMIAALTGQEVANASMYDGATAVAEAALMARRLKKGRQNVAVYGELHPHYRAVLETYLAQWDGKVLDVREDDWSALGDDTACLIVQVPDFHGEVHGYEDLRTRCDEAGCLMVVAVTEIVSLGMLPAPELADIVAGEAQSIGVPMSFGGPHLGFFACKKKNVRQMPGRLCGQTVDAEGKTGYVLTLSTREQHIRRDKATSNICSNQGLMALAFTVHLSLLGEVGLKKLAFENHQRACALADALAAIPKVEICNQHYFNEFRIAINASISAPHLVERLAEKGVMAGLALDERHLLLAATEMTSDGDIAALTTGLNAILSA